MTKQRSNYVPVIRDKFLKSRPQLPKLMLHYNDQSKIRWDLAIMVLALINCLSIPFDISFEPPVHIAYYVFEGLVDLMFAVDLVL